MKLKNYLLILTCIVSTQIFACHQTSVTETNVTDNGNGTYTYTLEVCMGSEDTYGFELDFNGANIISVDTPCITSSTTGEIICAVTPSLSGTGDVEFGDYDNTLLNPFNGFGDGQLCVTVQVTLDDPAADVDLFGTEESIGFCGDNGDLTSCFGQLTSTGTGTDASSGCSDDGEVSATASNGFSPYAYSWDNGGSGSTISGLSGGTYVATITDAEGCTTTESVTIAQPNPDYTIDLTSNCGGPNDATWVIDDPSGNPIGSGTQTTGTNQYTVCGCGSFLTLNYGTQGGQACTSVALEVFDINGTSIGTTTIDGASLNLDCGVLPVGLLSSNATYSNSMNNNTINWSTATEKNNDYFTIEYSSDGINWREVSNINGAGTTSHETHYEFRHNDFNSSSVNYYKILQTDFDGTTKVISIMSVDNRSSKKLIKMVNLMGQEVSENYSGIVIKSFTDGSVEKTYL
jgi:hypothetical protein